MSTELKTWTLLCLTLCVGDIVCFENYAHFWKIIPKEVPSLLSSRQLLFEPPLKVHFSYLEGIWDQYWWNNISQLCSFMKKMVTKVLDAIIAEWLISWKVLRCKLRKSKTVLFFSHLMLACFKDSISYGAHTIWLLWKDETIWILKFFNLALTSVLTSRQLIKTSASAVGGGAN